MLEDVHPTEHPRHEQPCRSYPKLARQRPKTTRSCENYWVCLADDEQLAIRKSSLGLQPPVGLAVYPTSSKGRVQSRQTTWPPQVSRTFRDHRARTLESFQSIVQFGAQ